MAVIYKKRSKYIQNTAISSVLVQLLVVSLAVLSSIIGLIISINSCSVALVACAFDDLAESVFTDFRSVINARKSIKTIYHIKEQNEPTRTYSQQCQSINCAILHTSLFRVRVGASTPSHVKVTVEKLPGMYEARQIDRGYKLQFSRKIRRLCCCFKPNN